MKMHDVGRKIDSNDIFIFEEKINGKLSDEYKKFLLENNGGYVDDYLVTPKFIEINPITLEKFSCTTSPDRFYNIDELYEEYEDNLDDPVLPYGYISIAYDTGGNQIVICVDGSCDNGKIYFANHELYDSSTGFLVITKLYDSFNEFIESLQPFGDVYIE